MVATADDEISIIIVRRDIYVYDYRKTGHIYSYDGLSRFCYQAFRSTSLLISKSWRGKTLLLGPAKTLLGEEKVSLMPRKILFRRKKTFLTL
jgi:hypothetical protein